jgi:hypothetical protein
MRYLLTIFLACSVVLGFLAYYYHNRANSYCELWKNTQANNDYLIKQREKDIADTLEVSKRNAELEELAKNSKESCWNRVIPADDSILIRLHQN